MKNPLQLSFADLQNHQNTIILIRSFIDRCGTAELRRVVSHYSVRILCIGGAVRVSVGQENVSVTRIVNGVHSGSWRDVIG